jgi:hypothetical protein
MFSSPARQHRSSTDRKPEPPCSAWPTLRAAAAAAAASTAPMQHTLRICNLITVLCNLPTFPIHLFAPPPPPPSLPSPFTTHTYTPPHSLKRSVFSRAFINFNTPQDVMDFKARFEGHLFVSSRGTQYRCTVEYAPFQKVPSTRTKKLPMEGTIEKGVQEDGGGVQSRIRSTTLYLMFIAERSSMVPLLTPFPSPPCCRSLPPDFTHPSPHRPRLPGLCQGIRRGPPPPSNSTGPVGSTRGPQSSRRGSRAGCDCTHGLPAAAV